MTLRSYFNAASLKLMELGTEEELGSDVEKPSAVTGIQFRGWQQGWLSISKKIGFLYTGNKYYLFIFILPGSLMRLKSLLRERSDVIYNIAKF